MPHQGARPGLVLCCFLQCRLEVVWERFMSFGGNLFLQQLLSISSMGVRRCGHMEGNQRAGQRRAAGAMYLLVAWLSIKRDAVALPSYE